jgi:predicted PurR-regulated permease PerM
MAINIGIGNILEPKVMGQGLGLSPAIILISLVFWGWVLGPIGMLLSVPLTMSIKIGLEGLEETRGIALILSSKPPPEDG